LRPFNARLHACETGMDIAKMAEIKFWSRKFEVASTRQ
jgi:hypothetical protein